MTDHGEHTQRACVRGCGANGKVFLVVTLPRRLSHQGPRLRVVLDRPFCMHHAATVTTANFVDEAGWRQLAALFREHAGLEPKRELTRLSFTRIARGVEGTNER